MIFSDTGATTAQANNLVLSVMNDGTVYKDRQHIVFAALQSASHRGLSMRDLVQSEAAKQRKQGAKFSAAHIREAADLIWNQTLSHCLTLIREAWNGQNFEVSALLWFDKVNGNTYHSCRIRIPYGPDNQARIVDVPYQYGYGNQWQYSALETLRNIGFNLPKSVPSYQLPVTFGSAVHTKKKQMYGGVHIFKGMP